MALFPFRLVNWRAHWHYGRTSRVDDSLAEEQLRGGRTERQSGGAGQLVAWLVGWSLGRASMLHGT